VVGKIGVEIAVGRPLFVQPGDVPFRVLPSAHALACAGALLGVAMDRWTAKAEDTVAES
jgi:hypothetical protein